MDGRSTIILKNHNELFYWLQLGCRTYMKNSWYTLNVITTATYIHTYIILYLILTKIITTKSPWRCTTIDFTQQSIPNDMSRVNQEWGPARSFSPQIPHCTCCCLCNNDVWEEVSVRQIVNFVWDIFTPCLSEEVEMPWGIEVVCLWWDFAAPPIPFPCLWSTSCNTYT